MASEHLPILQPKPRRYFNHEALPPQPPSPQLVPISDASPSRAQSYVNLTSSTLLGIYAPEPEDEDDEDASRPSTPWGTGVEKIDKIRQPAHLPRLSTWSPTISHAASTRDSTTSLIVRSVLLFTLGMLYGLLVRHLHDHRRTASGRTSTVSRSQYEWSYLLVWGAAGLGLGSLMPWIDLLWTEAPAPSIPGSADRYSPTPVSEAEEKEGLLVADWTPMVRSVGAFVGIAFAIRKLPWTSPLQASLTLFLVNPVLWYIIDRTRTGFVLSAAVGGLGTMLLMSCCPEVLPSPLARHTGHASGTTEELHNLVVKAAMEHAIWILSVLFCSCVCFGNVGRRLALIRGLERKRSHARRRSKSFSNVHRG